MKILFISALLLFAFLLSCKDKKGNPNPSVTDLAVVQVDMMDFITDSSARFYGTILSNGNSVPTSAGFVLGTNPEPTLANTVLFIDLNSDAGFSRIIYSLNQATLYYIRAFATNSFGTSYSVQKTFTTLYRQPGVATLPAFGIMANAVTANGRLINSGVESVVEKGFCWSTSANPTIASNHTVVAGTDTGKYFSGITGLQKGTLYHIRAYATNGLGTGYGADVTITTATDTRPVDGENNLYDTVRIGAQTWMLQNLRTAKYSNGDVIPTVANASEWGSGIVGRWIDTVSRPEIYGKLYNRYAVADARKLCPAGWHVPSQSDWMVLTDHLGGEFAAGIQLKTIDGWALPNIPGNNNSGFSAVPGGSFSNLIGGYYYGRTASFWGVTSNVDSYKQMELYAGTNQIYIWHAYVDIGLAVRCLKD